MYQLKTIFYQLGYKLCLILAVLFQLLITSARVAHHYAQPPRHIYAI